MKRRTTFTWMMIPLLLMLLIPLSGRGDPGRKITVMIYMCGSNLESSYGSATADMQEMTAAGINTQEISVLVMTGGSSSWASGNNPEETIITEIGSRGQRILERYEKQNMGEKETLESFLAYGTQARPANRYALIFWDHGGGPMEGVCWDELAEGDHLTMDELTEALAESPFGEEKLAWIGFDACLMSTVEVAGRLAPYAEYMIASQAEEPASGWNYNFLRGLEQDEDGAATGRRIVDDYFETPREGQPDLTMACVDLAQIAAIEEKMSRMYLGIAANLSTGTFSEIANLRFAATGFGKSAESAQGTEGYDLVDLVSLTSSYRTLDPDGATEIQEAVRQAVVYHRENMRDSHGLSVYHPFRNQQKFTERWSELYAGLSGAPGYAAYVDAYGRIMTGEQLVRWNHLDRISWDQENQEVSCVLSQEQAENLASVRLVVMAYNAQDAVDESYFRVYESAEVQRIPVMEEDGEKTLMLSAMYQLESLQAIGTEVLVPVTGALSYRISEEGTILVDLYPVGEDRVLPERPVIGEYIVDPDTREFELKSYMVYDEMTGIWSQRAEANLDQYEGIVFLKEYRNPMMNEMGEILSFDQWTRDAHEDTHTATSFLYDGTAFQLSFSADMMYAEWLEAAFEITDTQGNTYMTERVMLDFNRFKLYSDVKGYLPDDAARQEGLIILREEDISIVLKLENCSEVTEQYNIYRLAVNGISMDPRYSYVSFMNMSNYGDTISPGEQGLVWISFDREMLKASDPEGMIRTVSGTYIVFSENDETAKMYSFIAEPHLSMALPEGEEEVMEDLELKCPAAGDARLTWTQSASVYTGIGADGITTARISLGLRMTNLGDRNLIFGLTLNELNGKPAEEKGAVAASGTGTAVAPDFQYKDKYGNQMTLLALGPGERSMVTLNLGAEDIAAVAPDVSLQECVCLLMISEVTKTGDLEVYDYFPLRFTMDIPLTPFYPDARALPTSDDIDRMGSITESELLLSWDGIEIYHHSTFFAPQEALMLLRAENNTDKVCSLQMHHAAMGDQEASIGGQYSDYVYIRNTRRKVMGIAGSPWPGELFAYLKLQPGEEKYWYVTVYGENVLHWQKEGGFSFDLLIIPEGKSMHTSHFIFTSEDGREGFHIGELTPLLRGQNLLSEKVEVKELDRMVHRLISLQADAEQGRIKNAGYILFQRYDSMAETAESNIIMSPEISEERRWLVPVSYGQMQRDETGQWAFAVFPGIQLSVRSGEDGMMIPGVDVAPDEEGIIRIYGGMDILHFMTHDQYMDQSLTKMLVRWNPATGETALEESEGADELNADWADMVFHLVYCLPGESSGREMLAFMSDYFEGENMGEKESMLQIMPISDHQIRLAIEPLEDPENCEVLIFWTGEDGITRSTGLIPLTSFPEAK